MSRPKPKPAANETAPASLERFSQLYQRPLPYSLESEMALLGAMILDPRVIPEVAAVVTRRDFYSEAHGAIYAALTAVYDTDPGFDLVHVVNAMRDAGTLESAGGVEYLAKLANETPSAAGAQSYSRSVQSYSRLRRLAEVGDRLVYEVLHAGPVQTHQNQTQEILDAAESAIFELSEQPGRAPNSSTLEELMEQTLDAITSAEGVKPGVPTGFLDLDRLLLGLHPSDMVVLAARPSIGKAQPLDAQVLTPNGFVPMGLIRLDDEVIGSDGAPCRVQAVHHHSPKRVWKVVFADGGSTRCCDDHLWSTTTKNERRRGRGPSVRPLSDIRKSLRGADGVPNHHVPWVDPVAFGDAGARPIPPYTLGLWLGDGCRGFTARFSNPEPDLQSRIAGSLPSSDVLTISRDAISMRVKRRQRNNCQSGLQQALEALGLSRLESHQRFIPRSYKLASPSERLELLRGLLDSDGFVAPGQPCVEYLTTSTQLAADVRFVVWSLGGWCSLTPKKTSFRHRGEIKSGRPAFRLVIGFNNGTIPVSSKKHLAKLSPRERAHGRAIAAIEDAGVEPCQCITVTGPGGLYVTDDFIVTHNSALAAQIALAAGKAGVPAGVFSLEMRRDQLVRRWLATESDVDAERIRSGKLSDDELARVRAAAEALGKLPVFVDDSASLTIFSLRAQARRMVARHHVGLIVVDYLQLLTAPESSRENRQVEVSAISRGIKALARETGVPVLVLSQLNRQSEQREGFRPRMSDLRESGSIEQDADVVMLLHREDFHHKEDPGWAEDNPEKVNVGEVIVCKQRDGPVGTVHLTWSPRQVCFKNFAVRAAWEGAPPHHPEPPWELHREGAEEMPPV